jgi:hypothetical protein
MRLVATLAMNPSQLPLVLGAITWELIPERFKGPIIDQVLQACLSLARAVDLPNPYGLPIGTILKHGLIGFLERSLSFPTGMKVRVANRMAGIVLNPSMDFTLGFLKGLVLGLWDGVTGPFVLLWDLIKVGYEIQAAQMRLIMRLTNREARERLGQQVQAALERIGNRIGQVVGQLMSGRTNPESILQFLDQLIAAALRQVESLGASLADALLRFLNRPDRQFGESLGWLSGTIAFEVLLLVLTEGGYTVLKNSLQGLRAVIRLVEAAGAAWEALGPVRAALAGFRTFAMGNRVLGPLLEAIEEVFSLLVRFLRFSYGMGAPEGAAGRAAEHGIGTAERSAAREVRVAETATRETHEISLLADGRLIRCSDRCLQLADSIMERSVRMERAGMQAEGRQLTAEAQNISQEARALQANTGLSDAERAAQEQALLRRAEALERRAAEAEQQLMQRLREGAEGAANRARTFMQENAGNPRLRQFETEIAELETNIARNRQLAGETLDPEMRQLVEEEFQALERQARDLERRIQGELPVGVVPSGRRYDPTRKHGPGGWGTPMDLDDAVAQQVLENGILGPNGRQVYGHHNGRIYEFQPDNVGAFHGYPVPGNEVPPAVLRQMRDQGTITESQYRRLLRGQ